MQAVPNLGDPVLGGNNLDRVGYVRQVSPSAMADLCGQSAFWVTIVWLDPDGRTGDQVYTVTSELAGPWLSAAKRSGIQPIELYDLAIFEDQANNK
jgi:hypothetical protein